MAVMDTSNTFLAFYPFLCDVKSSVFLLSFNHALNYQDLIHTFSSPTNAQLFSFLFGNPANPDNPLM